jgi:voltage-gated potassium channel
MPPPVAHPVREPSSKLLFGWDAIMVLLAIASMAVVVVHDGTDDPVLRARLVLLDYLLVGVFLLDFLWDLRRADDRARFLRRNWWALLGMVPIAVTGLDYLRFLRIVRALRVLRAFRSLGKFLGSAQRAMERSQVGKLAVVSGSIMLVGSVLVWFAERGANPQLASYSEALWWAVVTITTVGYGDITPHTTLGRIIAAALMVTGIGTIGMLAGQVGSHLVGQKEEPVAAASGLAGELERLARLRAQGALTEAEFEAAKRRLLSPEAGAAPDSARP